MSRNEAEHVVNGPIARTFSFSLWAAALSLVAMTGFAQVDKMAGAALSVAEKAAGRDVAYLAVVVMFASMAFAWWMASKTIEVARQAAIAMVETARATQRIADAVEEKIPSTLIDDEGTRKLLQARSKRHE